MGTHAWLEQWEAAGTLGNVPTPELARVIGCVESLYILALNVARKRGEEFDALPLREVQERVKELRMVLMLERVRRRWAHDRANLAALADRAIEDLDRPVALQPKEFIRGFGMRVRERTGIELDDEAVLDLVRRVTEAMKDGEDA